LTDFLLLLAAGKCSVIKGSAPAGMEENVFDEIKKNDVVIAQQATIKLRREYRKEG
jgi:hypothetical protein